MSWPGLDAAQARSLMEELSARCRRAGIRTELTVVGGAALLLHGFDRGTTHDVDVRVTGDERVRGVIRDMASEFGLPDDWCNSSAAPWVPPLDGNEEWLTDDIVVASQEALLAMKVVASRGRDREDIERLCERLGVKTAEALVSLVDTIYGEGIEMVVGYGGHAELVAISRSLLPDGPRNDDMERSRPEAAAPPRLRPTTGPPNE